MYDEIQQLQQKSQHELANHLTTEPKIKYKEVNELGQKKNKNKKK